LQPPRLDQHASAPYAHLAEDYLRARKKTAAWLDRLVVDPIELSRIGAKGKKKYTEILDAYLVLHRSAGTAHEQHTVRERLHRLAQQTQRADYHDLDTVTDQQFKQDILSYLRALWILRRLGLESALHATQAQKLQTRIREHLSQRGPHALATFALYYDAFGWEKPPELHGNVLSRGVIAHRVPFGQFTQQLGYDLTHEVYAIFGYGLVRSTFQFSADDRTYLASILPQLSAQAVQNNDIDLLSELLSCMNYLGMHEHPLYRLGVQLLLATQRPEGSWGEYEHYRDRVIPALGQPLGDLVEQLFYLHTTFVSLRALTEAFETNAGPLWSTHLRHRLYATTKHE
jgi:hypothetical protein